MVFSDLQGILPKVATFCWERPYKPYRFWKTTPISIPWISSILLKQYFPKHLQSSNIKLSRLLTFWNNVFAVPKVDLFGYLQQRFGTYFCNFLYNRKILQIVSIIAWKKIYKHTNADTLMTFYIGSYLR